MGGMIIQYFNTGYNSNKEYEWKNVGKTTVNNPPNDHKYGG